jgi:hypothetical protein
VLELLVAPGLSCNRKEYWEGPLTTGMHYRDVWLSNSWWTKQEKNLDATAWARQ